MLKDITLGQFFPGKSILHRLDPRSKILLTIMYIVIVFLTKNLYCYIALLISSFILVLLSGISLKVVFKGLKPVIFILIFTTIITLFFTKGDTLLWSFWRFEIYRESIYRALMMIVRILTLIIGTSVLLTYTTSPVTLTDAIEDLLSPLKVLHIPVHDFAMMMTIALRFIPTLIDETDRIMTAQKARGASFSHGGLMKRAKALVPVLVPLLVSAFNRADELATAMECRCYRGGKGRTKLHKLRYRPKDFIFMLGMVAFGALIVLGNIYIPTLPIFSFSV